MPRRHTARRFTEENPAVMAHVAKQAELADRTYAVQDMVDERRETDLDSARDLCSKENELLQMAKDQLESFNQLFDETMQQTATLLMDDMDV